MRSICTLGSETAYLLGKKVKFALMCIWEVSWAWSHQSISAGNAAAVDAIADDAVVSFTNSYL